MRIAIPSFRKFLLPICLLGIVGNGVHYLSIIFTGNVRWLLLATLLMLFILKKKLLIFLDPQLFFVLFLYVAWCFCTLCWSENYTLSFFKSVIFIITVITMISAGIDWIRTNHMENWLDYLGLLTFVSMLIAFLGKHSINAFENANTAANFGIYKGFVNNANWFGMMMAFSLPFLLWKSYLAKLKGKRYLLWTLLVISCIYFLLSSLSRSSILASTITILGFVANLSLSKKLQILFLSLIAVVVFSIFFNTDFLTNLATKYIYKNDQITLFQSRQHTWGNSYEGALQGGWFGLGYGISYGMDEYSFDHGLSTIGYGREKGNAQLAIIEETGLVGLILYFVFLVTIIFKLFILYVRVRDPSQKVLLGIISGVFFGMIAQSVFEAWWSSPGSPESFFFWTLIGVIRGLEIVVEKQRMYHDENGFEAQNRPTLAAPAY